MYPFYMKCDTKNCFPPKSQNLSYGLDSDNMDDLHFDLILYTCQNCTSRPSLWKYFIHRLNI